MKTKVNTEIFTADIANLANNFSSGNEFLDQLFADFMQKVFILREEYIGFSFVTLAATDEGYSLYKRNYFEDLEEDFHFSFKDDEKGCRPMYLALDIE